MPDTRPDYSLKSVEGQRGSQKPELLLVRFFQIKEAEYMKPPLAEQLQEPDSGTAPSTFSGGLVVTGACSCNSVCTCVPVALCTCNTVCVCNTVSSSHGISSGGGGGGYGGYGGYFAPCF